MTPWSRITSPRPTPGTCASTSCARPTCSPRSAPTTDSHSPSATSTGSPSPKSPSCSAARPTPPRRCWSGRGRRSAVCTWKEKVMTDPLDALRRTRDAAAPRPAFVAELADRLRVELGIREGDEVTQLMRTAMGDMPVRGNVPRALLDVIEDQGYAVLENALSPADMEAVRDGLAPYL